MVKGSLSSLDQGSLGYLGDTFRGGGSFFPPLVSQASLRPCIRQGGELMWRDRKAWVPQLASVRAGVGSCALCRLSCEGLKLVAKRCLKARAMGLSDCRGGEPVMEGEG